MSESPYIISDPSYRWSVSSTGFFAGSAGARILEAIRETAAQSEHLSCSMIDGLLSGEDGGFFSGMLETEHYVIGWVDHIRSYPLYYRTGATASKLIISNNARALCETDMHVLSQNEVSTCEFARAGFVTGRDTLYDEIKCLQSGEYLIWDKRSQSLSIHRYFQYIPAPVEKKTEEALRSNLGEILDNSIRAIIARANGRPIWIPLSAGLDSRIILCKLHEAGYKNLHTFTYGPVGNFEALYARKTAKKLNVPWHYVPISRFRARKAFQSPARKAYSAFADGLKVAPSLREFTALEYLCEKNIIHRDAIIINGQSGDYITGGHVASAWFQKQPSNRSDLHHVLLKKHYDLWRSLTGFMDENIKSRIDGLLPPEQKVDPVWRNAILEECWEYDARQVGLVIHGQRSYDFFGFDWELPLWDKPLVEFYRHVPYQLKKGQYLFKNYLKAYNYKGLFPAKEPNIWRWPLPVLWVLPLAQVVGLLGTAPKQSFYSLMRYFGHYSNQYAFFPFKDHFRTRRHARNIFSLYVRHWINENNFLLPPPLREALKIDDK